MVAPVALGQAAGCKLCDVMMQQDHVAQQVQQQQQLAQQQQAGQLQQQQPASQQSDDQVVSEEDVDVIQSEVQHACEVTQVIQQSESCTDIKR